MERRFSTAGEAAKIEKRDDGTEVLVGYAAVFYRDGDPSTEYRLGRNMVERIDPDAFSRAMSEGDDARALFNHDSNHLLGRRSADTLRLSADKTGLRYEIDLPDTQTGRDVAESVRRGDLTGSSFAFAAEGVQWVEDGENDVRTITSARLFDVGPVTYPAYEGTTTAVRSDEDASGAEAERKTWKAERKAAEGVRKRARARLVDLESQSQ